MNKNRIREAVFIAGSAGFSRLSGSNGDHLMTPGGITSAIHEAEDKDKAGLEWAYKKFGRIAESEKRSPYADADRENI